MTGSCGSCAWFREGASWDGGGCYRFPPNVEGQRPPVEEDTPACGEWEGETFIEFTPDAEPN